MNGQTLADLCRADATLEKQFGGVFSVDNLPFRVARYPSAYIVNTAPSLDRGQHWLAIYFSSARRSIVFDSFGTLPSPVRSFVVRNSVACAYNTHRIQNIRSQTCGLYTLLFLLVVCRYSDVVHFLHLFDDDTLQNDFYVYQLVCSIF